MAKRVPLTAMEKEWIAKRKGEVMTLQQIARELRCSFFTVRKWWRCLRDGRQVQRRGRPRKGILSTYPVVVAEKAVELKRVHPHWGPSMVKLELKRQLSYDLESLPSNAPLSALFKERCPEAVQPRERRAYAERPPLMVKQPHQRWQVDAQEGLRLSQGEAVSVLDVRDMMSGLMIGAHAFVTTTEKRWRKLTLRETQQALRQDFSLWGKPEAVQTDHETVYVGSSDENYLSPFTSWLVGLGIEHIVSRTHRPTDQSQVERNHRTQGDMVWKDQSFDQLEQFQQALDENRQRYNEEFPVQAGQCQGRPPLQVYPFARSSGRPFDPAFEWEVFNMEWVDAYLARFVCPRQVSANGVVTLCDHRYYLGRKYHGQRVSAQFIPGPRVFRFKTTDGTFIRDLPALGLDKEDILGFMPANDVLRLHPFQLPLPLQGV